MGTSPAIRLWTVRYRIKMMTHNFASRRFHTQKLYSRLPSTKLNFTGKNSKIAFLCHPLRDIGVELNTIYLHGKYDDSSFSRSTDIIGFGCPRIWHESFVILMLGLTAQLCTKCDDSSCSSSRNVVGAYKNVNKFQKIQKLKFNERCCNTKWCRTM